jgi:Tfp pilus assembly protein PilF
MEKISKLIDNLISWLIVTIFALLPLFFLPLTTNFYSVNKLVLLSSSALILLSLWGIRILVTGVISLPKGINLAGFSLLTLSSILSLIFVSSNRIESLVAQPGLATFLSLLIIYFISLSILNDRFKKILMWTTLGSFSLLGLTILYQYFGIGKLMFPDIAFMNDPLWNPTGNALTVLASMLILIPIILELVYKSTKNKNEMMITFSTIALILCGSSAIILCIQIIPIISNQILPYSEAWRIMIEVLKTPLSALFGAGQEKFLVSFTRGRSPIFNMLPIWNIRFTSSSSTFLHIGTTLGVFGMISLIIVLRPFITNFKKMSLGHKVSTILLILSLILSPPNIVLFTLIVSLLIVLILDDEPFLVTIPKNIYWVAHLIAYSSLIICLIPSYFIYRYYKGEYLFSKSLVAAQKNDGTNTYNLQIAALMTDPYITQYHITYSQTNLALANSIASQAKTSSDSAQATKLSENDRQLVSQLLQQSIREAKVATTLSPDNISAWETLANIYQNIMGIVTGAESWSIATFQKAIQLDPVNPVLRFNLAGIFLAKQNYDNAIQLLLEAISLKPDVANYYFNIAFAYKQKKQYLNEALALKNCLNLIPSTSQSERQKVTDELESVKPNLTKDELTQLNGNPQQQSPNPTINQDGQIIEPNPPPQTQITPKIELPKEASPSFGNPQITPSPTPQSEPVPEATPSSQVLPSQP